MTMLRPLGIYVTQDYSSYTIAELQESLRVVDAQRYPENKVAIEAELEARVQSGDFERQVAAEVEARQQKAVADKAIAEKATVFIAWYLILSPIVILSYLNVRLTAGLFWIAAFFAAFAIYLAASHWVGRALLKGKTWAYPAAIAILSLQVLRITSDAIYVQILSLVGGYVTFGEGGSIGIAGYLEPGIQVSWGNQMPFEIGINILAILMIYYLAAARREIE